MQIQIQHICTGESRPWGRGEKQLIHDPCSQNPNGRFGGGGRWMRRHNQAHMRHTGREGEIRTIEEGPLCSTLWVSRVGVWWLRETGSDGWQIKQSVLFATHDDPQPRQEEGGEYRGGAIQSIQTNQEVSKGQTEPACIADERLTGPC